MKMLLKSGSVMSVCCVTLLLLSAGKAIEAAPVDDKVEDWNSISLESSHLNPLPPLVGEKADFANFTRELVQVQWRAGDPIYLYVMIPKLVPKPPVILYLYDYGTEPNRFLNEKFVQQLISGGYAAVGFSAALDGQRYHDRPMKEWFVSNLAEALSKSSHDVQMILNYLETRGDVDVSRVAMFGEGSGGAIAVLAAAADKRLRAIDLINPWGDWPDWLAQSPVVPDDERQEYLAPSFLKLVENLDPVRWLPQLRIPVRVQFMGEDGAATIAARHKIESALPRQAMLIPSDQALAEYRATAGAKFLDWIKAQLNSQQLVSNAK
jgi:dienelactone hydrolase